MNVTTSSSARPDIDDSRAGLLVVFNHPGSGTHRRLRIAGIRRIEGIVKYELIVCVVLFTRFGVFGITIPIWLVGTASRSAVRSTISVGLGIARVVVAWALASAIVS